MTEPQRSPVRYGLEVVGAGMLAALAAWALVTALGVQLTVGKGTDATQVGAVPGPFAYSTGVPALPGSSRTVS